MVVIYGKKIYETNLNNYLNYMYKSKKGYYYNKINGEIKRTSKNLYCLFFNNYSIQCFD